MKKENFLFGCDEVKAFFSELISDGIFSHAYLIEGPEGSGKKSLAKYIAASLACGGNCNDCNICHRIAEGHCPDIKFISRSEGQKNISVDAVRDMIDDTSLTPLELDFKMYVIDGAERLSAQAQNSLLKIIEEPPKNDPYGCDDPNPLDIKACSATDCTGLIPAMPQSESELESYAELYHYPGNIFHG